jgi:NAD(P)-dependent dehydrogenase (short-subunit alcohol dehydrogenase family)
VKTAMIWGASGGIGRALVAELAAEGWPVIAVNRDGEEVPGATMTLTADITNSHSVSQAVLAAAYEVDQVDLWGYAAGDILAKPIEQMSPDDWRRVLGANLDGAFLATHHSMPLLAEDAYLVYLGAVSERLRLPGLSAYAAAKAGLEAFAEALRKEQRKRRILVVRPGAVATSFWDKVPMRLPKDAASPQKVGKRILEAYEGGSTGVLDLT